MNNIINYYYSMYPTNILETNSIYFFNYEGKKYLLTICNRPKEDIESLYKLNNIMLEKKLLVSEIITNNEKQAITFINNKPYVLLKICININAEINLYDIYTINKNTTNIDVDNILNRNDWVSLWESKNDFYESQLSELTVKYPIVNSYLNYYIGLAENAILYLKNIIKIKENVRMSICHRRVEYDEKTFIFYNPMEFIHDYFVRDISEYIKSVFFVDKEKAFNCIISFFNAFNPNYKEAQLFYARLLYPSYFFDIYDDIINGIKKEDEVEKVIIHSSSYETFLSNVYLYISRYYNSPIEKVDWLIKH